MKKILLCLLFPLLCQAQEIKVASGSLKLYPDFQSQYIGSRTVAVWLPEGYSPKEQYSVLYMNDGQALFDANANWNKQEWHVDETAGRLIAQGKTQKFIVVAIWNAQLRRHSEYFPQKPFESLAQQQQDSLYALGKVQNQPLLATKVASEQYLKFLVKELKVFVDHTFSVKKGRKIPLSRVRVWVGSFRCMHCVNIPIFLVARPVCRRIGSGLLSRRTTRFRRHS